MRKDIMINNNKKEIIIDTAANLFSEFGFHEINMDMIAKKAGIAKGTIYNYFKSKEIALQLLQSARGSYLISQALSIAVEQMRKVEPKYREESNIQDMEMLLETLFPMYVVVRKSEDEFGRERR
jgi:AcrR family transcriptional regulator